jgi:hypothetical protein
LLDTVPRYFDILSTILLRIKIFKPDDVFFAGLAVPESLDPERNIGKKKVIEPALEKETGWLCQVTNTSTLHSYVTDAEGT